MKRITSILSLLSIITLLSITGCKDDNEDIFEIYNGTLTVLQKDAYSNTPGRNNLLWPPHTTTVFKWNNDESVRLNHGTAPNEKDPNSGDLMLDVVKTYSFQGSKEDLEKLQEYYKKAICDTVDGKPYNTFLSLVSGKEELAKVVLQSLGEFVTNNDHSFSHPGMTKEQVLQLIASGDVSKLMPLLANSTMTPSQLKTAIHNILKNAFEKLGKDITSYHVCNNDAALQVELIKNFIKTGEVQMPQRKCEGPMMYYFPR